jgi:hypothetical protein
MAKISELRAQFDKMTLFQKKQFCTDLKHQLEGSSSAKHKKFLSECLHKYQTQYQSSIQLVSDDELEAEEEVKHPAFNIPMHILDRRGRKPANRMAVAIRVCAFIVLAVFIAVSIAASDNIDLADMVMRITVGAAISMIMLAAAEALQILHDIRNNTNRRNR